jgi:mono/diheme cytochrome c family protein
MNGLFLIRQSFLRLGCGALAAASLLLGGCASVSKTPYPSIQADRSPEGVKRGEAIFRGDCEACHRGAGAQQASGIRLHELPPWMGEIYSANLTSHPTAGIGSAKDEELARVIRYGVNREGKLTVMAGYNMGDKDLAAVLGFLRSEDPLFKPDATVKPPTKFSFMGGLAFNMAFSLPDRPATGIPVPPKGPTVEYGRYMAQDVLNCAACHSPGLSADRGTSKKAFSGGFEFNSADGKPIYSANITFDATGIQGWTEEDFARAVRDGLAPDGSLVRPPMPRFRGLDEVDMKAIYEYLRTLPPIQNNVPGARPRPGSTASIPAAQPASVSSAAVEQGSPVRTSAAAQVPVLIAAQAAPAKAAPATVDPAALFTKVGCSVCHAPGARYHDRIVQGVAAKSPEELAKWIRNPEKFIPGTTMPTYASMIDEPTALALATWLKQGGAGAPTRK